MPAAGGADPVKGAVQTLSVDVVIPASARADKLCVLEAGLETTVLLRGPLIDDAAAVFAAGMRERAGS